MQRSLCIVLVAFLGVAAGCGGGGSDESTKASATSTSRTAPPPEASTVAPTARALTKAEFINQGDAICEETDKAQESGLQAYLKKHPEAQSTEAGRSRTVIAVGLPPIQTEVEELAALGEPSDGKVKVEAIVQGIEDAVKKAEEDPGSVLQGTGNPFTQVGKLAGEYGFKACVHAL